MKYLVKWQITKIGFFSDTVIPGVEVIEAEDKADALEKVEEKHKGVTRNGIVLTFLDVEPI